jgi:lambda family phage portal protein
MCAERRYKRLNLLDKAIMAISPEAGLKRQVARRKSAIIDSGYGNYGANGTKKAVIGWTHGGGSHREDIEEHVDTLRQRSRDLYYGGSNLATGAIKRLRTNTVGVGLHLKSTIDGSVLGLTEKQATDLEEQIEREFAHWANSVNCDLERLDNFYQLQQLALLNALLSGDSFALMTTTNRKGSVYDLRINLIEADRVSTPDNQTVNPLFCEGVEKNKDGEVVAYHISKFHPLSFQDREPREWVRVEAFGRKTGRRNVLHIMNRERIGQVRGVPFLSPVIETIKQLGRYTEAEVLAAVINGLFTVFIEKESASDEGAFGEVIPEEMQVDREDENSIELAPGAVIDLGEGEKANMVNPGRPNPNFDPFVMAVIKQIGAALEIPYEILIMAFSNNYSASRAAILEFFKVIKMYRAWFVADFCQPIYEEWLSEAVAKGRIYAPGFFNDPIIKDAYCSAEWNGPAAGQLDPKKEVEAAELRVQGGFSTRERETTELTGTDFYKNIKQRKREEELMQEVSKNAKKANADNRDKESDEDTDPDKDADRQDNPGNDSGEGEGEAEE